MTLNDTPVEEVTEFCVVFGELGKATCSRCRSVWYCGPECQRADWKRHKTASRTRSPALLSAGKPKSSEEAPSKVVKSRPGPPHAATLPPPEGGTYFVNRSVSGVPGDAAPFDLVLTPQKSVETARMVVETLKKRGVCVIKAGADKDFQRSCAVEAKLLLDSGEFAQGQKGQLTEPAGDRVEYSFRDDIVLWMTTAWHERQDRKGNALKVLDQQLTDFGLGLKPLLEEELGLYISKRSLGMLSCYDGGITPGIF